MPPTIQHLLASCMILGLTAISASAEQTTTITIAAQWGNAKIKGVPCTVIIAGTESHVLTPAKVDFPSDQNGAAKFDKISCVYKGITRVLKAMPSPDIGRIGMNFENDAMGILFYN